MSRIIAERSDVLPILGEVFREYGYDGASLSVIKKATDLGNGSLYNFFPGGKEEMLTAVLTDIDQWFEINIFAPLMNDENSRRACSSMINAVEKYFDSGYRVCLVGAIALNDPHDLFATNVSKYFERWLETLTNALRKLNAKDPRVLAEEIICGIQGAIILTRATNNRQIFKRYMIRIESKIT